MAYTGKLQSLNEGTAAEDMFNNIISWLTSSSFTAGRDWTIVKDWRGEGLNQVVLFNDGPSGSENVYIGLRQDLHSDGVNSGIKLKTYLNFDGDVMDFFDTTIGNPNGDSSALAMLPCWNSVMDYWVFSNRSRVILVVKTQTRYGMAYAGQLLRFMLPSEYPYPNIVFADGYGNTDWSTFTSYVSSSGRSAILFPSTSGASACKRIVDPSGSFRVGWEIIPTRDIGGGWPTHSNFVNPVHYRPGEVRALIPLYVVYDGQCFGQLDDMYWAPGYYNTPEGQHSVGGSTYIVFPNVDQTGWQHFLAIKEA